MHTCLIVSKQDDIAKMVCGFDFSHQLRFQWVSEADLIGYDPLSQDIHLIIVEASMLPLALPIIQSLRSGWTHHELPILLVGAQITSEWIQSIGIDINLTLSQDLDPTCLYLQIKTLVDLAKLARSQKDLKPAGIRGLSLANLGRLFAELVHELKNPLQIIVSYADMLSKDLSQPNLTIEQKNNAMSRAVRIQDAVFRMSKLIKLTLNQVQHGENEDFKLVPIAEIISDSLHLTKPALHQKQIHLILNPFPAEWEVRCKAIALSQVLINLLNNAGDAIENLAERWIKINVSEGIQHYSITVIDSGRSIPEEAAKQIFTPFFSSKEGGAGLGLALSQTTIKSHGGNLKLDTEAQNTSFTFTLPKP